MSADETLVRSHKFDSDFSHSTKWRDSSTYSITGKGEPKSINKSFLVNTICSVESHNRREEIDECWRTHSLSKKRKLDSSASEDKQIQKAINEVREGWAMKKLAAMEKVAGNQEKLDVSDNSDDSTASTSSDIDSDSHSKKRKKSLNKEKKKKKKKKHSKKSKRKDRC